MSQRVSGYSNSLRAPRTTYLQMAPNQPKFSQPVALSDNFISFIQWKADANPFYRRLFLDLYMTIRKCFDDTEHLEPIAKDVCQFHGKILGFSDEDFETLWGMKTKLGTELFLAPENDPVIQAFKYTQDEVWKAQSVFLLVWFSDQSPHRCHTYFTNFYSSSLMGLLDTDGAEVINFLKRSLTHLTCLNAEESSYFERNATLFLEISAVACWHSNLRMDELGNVFASEVSAIVKKWPLENFSGDQMNAVKKTLEGWPQAVFRDKEDKNRRKYLLAALDFAIQKNWHLATKYILDQFVPTHEDILSDGHLFFTSNADLLINKGVLVSLIQKALEYTPNEIALTLYDYNQRHCKIIKDTREITLNRAYFEQKYLDKEQALAAMSFFSRRLFLFNQRIFMRDMMPLGIPMPSRTPFLDPFVQINKDSGTSYKQHSALEEFVSDPIFDKHVLRFIAGFVRA